MDVIEQKIIDFFDRFCTAHNEQPSKVKIVIQLIDNSTVNLTPLYSVHSESIDKYCLLNEIIHLNMLEKTMISYSKINNYIGKFMENNAMQQGVSCEKVKGMITIKNEKLVAALFVDGKMHSQFSVTDFVK